MSGFIGRIIYVAAKYEKELVMARNAAIGGAAGQAGSDAYKKVKEHLTRNGVPHGEARHEGEVPPTGHKYVQL